MGQNLLFDNDSIRERMQAMFESYVAHRASIHHGPREMRALRPESIEVYRDMWRSFAVYCQEAQLEIGAVAPEDLNEFLTYGAPSKIENGVLRVRAPRPATLRYQARMLSLIHKVSAFYAQSSGNPLNEAAKSLLSQPPFRDAHKDEFDPQAKLLSSEDIYTIRQRISATAREANRAHSAGPRIDWQDLRACAALSLHLGCGLTSKEVRNLRLCHVHTEGRPNTLSPGLPWKVHVVASGPSPAHDVPLPAWSMRALGAWMTVRARLDPSLNFGRPNYTANAQETDFVFPGKASGTQWSRDGHYRSCLQYLAEIGISCEKGGLYRLRHTFAVRQLQIKKRSIAEIQSWLGLRTPQEVERYRSIVLKELAVID